ncbi:MAG TPA: dimethylsulfonioproprionate lyase family protein [Dongiaceae bacterium]|nr:dimethylsulfonioproprionate lyase family protein [Dongiaceae bacterium]
MQHPLLALADAIDSYIDTCPLQHRELVDIRRRLRERLRPTTVAPIAPTAERPRGTELQPALDLARDQGAGAIVDALGAAGAYLEWVSYDSYPAADIGSHFPRRHRFASLIGPVDPSWSHDFDCGLLWIAPQTLYRDHHHPSPELYLPLTGPSLWRFGTDRPWIERQAGELIWNGANVVHATLVKEAPLLCLYAWTANVDAPAQVVRAADWHDIETDLARTSYR